MSRTRRTPAETAADLRAKLAKAETAAAMDEAKANPSLSPIAEALQTARDEKTALSRKRSGPQSFENRRVKHALWIHQIEAEDNLNSAQIESLSDQIGLLEYALTECANTVAAGGDLNMDLVKNSAATGKETFPDLEHEVETAKIARASYGKKETVSFENEASA